MIASAVLFSNSGMVFADQSPATVPTISWSTNYQQSLSETKNGNKAVVLFFTGSDWCSWCSKLEEEVLSKPEFANALQGKFTFVKVDFPVYHKLAPELTSQNQALKKRFSVKSFPTLVVLDSQEHVLGTTGYRPGGPLSFAAHLSSMIKSQ